MSFIRESKPRNLNINLKTYLTQYLIKKLQFNSKPKCGQFNNKLLSLRLKIINLGFRFIISKAFLKYLIANTTYESIATFVHFVVINFWIKSLTHIH